MVWEVASIAVGFLDTVLPHYSMGFSLFLTSGILYLFSILEALEVMKLSKVLLKLN